MKLLILLFFAIAYIKVSCAVSDMDWIGEESNESKEEDIESNESDLQDAAYQADLDKLEAYETDLGRMVETNEIGSVDSNESVELEDEDLSVRKLCKSTCSELTKDTLVQGGNVVVEHWDTRSKDPEACHLGCGSMKTTFDKRILLFPHTQPQLLLGSSMDTCYDGCNEIYPIHNVDCLTGCNFMQRHLQDRFDAKKKEEAPESNIDESFWHAVTDVDPSKLFETKEEDSPAGNNVDPYLQYQNIAYDEAKENPAPQSAEAKKSDEQETDGRISDFFGSVYDEEAAVQDGDKQGEAEEGPDHRFEIDDNVDLIIMTPTEFVNRLLIMRYIQMMMEGSIGGYADDRKQLDLPTNEDSSSYASTASALIQQASSSVSSAATKMYKKVERMDNKSLLLYIVFYVAGFILIYSAVNMLLDHFGICIKDRRSNSVPYTEDYYKFEKYNPALPNYKYKLPSYDDCMAENMVVADLHLPEEQYRTKAGIEQI